MSFSQENFKSVMSRFATGVTVVTTQNSDGTLCGMTVNSFSSVSLDPPLVLFCIDKNAHHHNDITDPNHFAINILAENQMLTSTSFATPSIIDWNEIKYNKGPNGSPILKNSIAYLECSKQHIYEGGDHSIIVGKILTLQELSDDKPLIYYNSQYNKIGDKI